MAKTTKRRSNAVADRQAPRGAWSPETLLTALQQGTAEDKVAALKMAGILGTDGKLTKLYKSWGTKVTRTPEAQDIEP